MKIKHRKLTKTNFVLLTIVILLTVVFGLVIFFGQLNKKEVKAQVASSRLSVSSSGHYLVYKNKAILMFGDSGTHVVLQDRNIDYRQWIDYSASVGINALHVWAMVAPMQKQDGSVIEGRYGYVYPGLTPWARKTTGPDANDQLKQWDLKQFDDVNYWPRIKDLISYAASKDMIVGITVFFGWPKWDTNSRPDWSYHPFNIINGGHLYDNNAVRQIYSPGIEVLNESWSDSWLSTKKTQWIWEKYSEKLIQETNSFGNVFYVFMDEHSYSEGNSGDHFMNFFKKRNALWADWNARRSNVDIVYEQHADPLNEFFRQPLRPIMELEESPPYMGNELRYRIWRHGIGGGHYFVHNDQNQETKQTGIMVYDPYVQGGRKDKVQERERWIGYASQFFNQQIMDLEPMIPHDELAIGARCLANPGIEYALYAQNGGTISVDLRGITGSFKVKWYNPRTGLVTLAGQTTGGDWRQFTAFDNDDWALLLTKEEVLSCLPADLNCDNQIGSQDLAELKKDWGLTGSSVDLNQDNLVDTKDLGIMMSTWGTY